MPHQPPIRRLLILAYAAAAVALLLVGARWIRSAQRREPELEQASDAMLPASTDGRLPLRTATVEELGSIKGIGPATARAIVEFRDGRGGLSSVDELADVSGVGPATMDALRARLQP